MDNLQRQADDLHAQTQETWYQFLLAEFLTCSTAFDFGNVEWELGNREVAEKEAYSIEKAYDTIRRFLPTIDSPERRNEIEGKLGDLRITLDTFLNKLRLGRA